MKELEQWFSYKLIQELLGEALMILVHVVNHFFFCTLNGDVSNKLLLRKDVSYNHSKVFGYRSFIHKDEISKLDLMSNKYISKGYGNEELYMF